METQSKSKIKNILKFLAIVLSGIGLVALLVVGVFFVRNETIIKDDKSVVLADSSGSCGDGVTYTLNELGILTISGTGAMTSHPWTVEAVRDSVKQVVVNNGVTELAYGAFSNCGNLTTANIAASVTSMGAYAFNNCRALKTITLNEGLQSIGNWAFQNCVNLKSITLPETLRTIGDYAFDHCNLITSLYIPKAVYSIGRSIISHCVSLSSLSVDDDNTTYTDSNGNAIIKISDNSLVTMPAGASIPNTVTKIGDFAFVDRTDITEIFIPYGVTSIGDYAFSGCYGLSSITLPSTLTSIGGSAFNYCTDLTSITLPNGLISIGGQAFYHCTGLTSITIPNSVTTISGGAFQECSGLTSIILSNNLESLEDMLFENCSNLTFVTIPSSVTSIGDYVFGYCYDLTSINIPNGVTHIGNGVFYSCYNLTSINIPSSVIQIGNLFGECPRLISITVDNENTVYNDGNGSNKIIETETGIVVAELEYETSGTCGDNLTWTLSNAGVLTISGTGAMTNYLVNSPWNNNQLIKSVVIGNGVTSIGDFAFFECYNLMQVTIPDSVTSIGTHAFASCRSLRSITLSNNILSIGSYAFDSSGLLEIYNYTDLQSSEIDNARTNTYVPPPLSSGRRRRARHRFCLSESYRI